MIPPGCRLQKVDKCCSKMVCGSGIIAPSEAQESPLSGGNTDTSSLNNIASVSAGITVKPVEFIVKNVVPSSQHTINSAEVRTKTIIQLTNVTNTDNIAANPVITVLAPAKLDATSGSDKPRIQVITIPSDAPAKTIESSLFGTREGFQTIVQAKDALSAGPIVRSIEPLTVKVIAPQTGQSVGTIPDGTIFTAVETVESGIGSSDGFQSATIGTSQPNSLTVQDSQSVVMRKFALFDIM